MAFWTSHTVDRGVSIHLAVTQIGICRVCLGSTDRQFTGDLHLQQPLYTWRESQQAPLLREAVKQLSAYFRRELTKFELPLDLNGTQFQLKVWKALQEIPYGQTRTYAEIAREINAPKATRAVGGANHENPIPIIVPCHRVIAAGGKLGGFASGLDYKRLLLDVEQMAATI
jgi:methylated-DNA-[protein]-cysteine S-methyltransferase